MPWTREGLYLDDDGHWIPIGHYDESEDDGEGDSGDGYGTYVSGSRSCMHTTRACRSLRGADYTSWLLLCENIQEEASTVTEAWTLVGTGATVLCGSSPCAVSHHGGAVFRGTGVRRLWWCRHCASPTPHSTEVHMRFATFVD